MSTRDCLALGSAAASSGNVEINRAGSGYANIFHTFVEKGVLGEQVILGVLFLLNSRTFSEGWTRF